MSYGELDARVTRLARALRQRGVGAGDRVAVLALNGMETWEAYLAGVRLGAIVVPVNFRLVPDEVAYVLTDSGAVALVVDTALAEVAAKARELAPAVTSTLTIGGDYEEALAAAIEVARSGNRLGDIGEAIGTIARANGYSVNTQFGGHGVGRTMHGEPHVPNDGRAGRGLKLREGLVIAIEPWLMAGTDQLVQDADGWTLRSTDGSRAAHSEHTIAVTAGDPLVLTARDR